ncbi:MAG: P-loop NTPase [Desulfobacterales bacterium]|nr:P-loop NTPase [Desulfobacterales bacterium]
MAEKTTIIPIASGKGGVGKSFLTANLSIAIAKLGYSTAVVDLDLGGSNLYTYLGIPNKHPGIGDYLKGKKVRFSDLLVRTKTSNLKYIPGDGRTPFMADIPYAQRQILLGELKRIPARYVLLDLGSGSTFNTLNFYGIAHKGIIVTTSEVPSIMNSLAFLRNFMFYIILKAVSHNKEALKMLTTAFRQPIKSEPLSVKSLLHKISSVDSDLAIKAHNLCSNYRPRIIVNMGDSFDELKVLRKIDEVLKTRLSIEADYFGFIYYDDVIRRSVQNSKILFLHYPQCLASKSIKNVAIRITKIWDQPVENSMVRLFEDTKRKHALWKI